MKKLILLAGLTAILTTAGCSTPAPATPSQPASSPKPAAPAATPATPAAATEGAQDFTLVNKTGLVIDKVFVSPHASDDWEEDVLGQDQLLEDAMVDIKFKRSEKAAMWDLKVEDTKGNAVMWSNLNLLEISKVTIRNDGGKATAEVE
jgi:hypothetical protein